MMGNVARPVLMGLTRTVTTELSIAILKSASPGHLEEPLLRGTNVLKAIQCLVIVEICAFSEAVCRQNDGAVHEMSRPSRRESVLPKKYLLYRPAPLPSK